MAKELRWDDLYPNLVQIPAEGDGSCFFHAIVAAFHGPYSRGEIDKKAFIQDLRKDLATKLDEYYPKLGRGEITSLGKTNAEFSLQSMKKGLLEMGPVGNQYKELVSEVFNKDIYILWDTTHQIYNTGDNLEDHYKNRESVVIGWFGGTHFDLIGHVDRQRGIIQTLFPHDHPFIVKLKESLR